MKIENVVVISLEDYTEYQELKNKKNEIDFSRLKTGSVVKVTYDGGNQILANIDTKRSVQIVSINTGFVFTRTKTLTESRYKYDLNVIQDENLSSFASNYDQCYITEVISY